MTDDLPLEAAPLPNLSERGPPQQDLNTAPATGPILGNRRSHIYHRPDCPNYQDIAPKNRVPFTSAADAERAGYRQARNCP